MDRPALRAARPRRRGRCMLVDGDAFYTVDIVGMYRAVSGRAGASFVFHDTQPKPIYSYVKRDGNSAVITAIKEKVKISDWANTGCYCFKSGSDLLAYCALIIEKGETQLSQDQKGEFYTSGVIKAMLDAGEPFEALVLAKDAMHVLGTPAQLVEFCQHWPAPVAQRFCFDIDNTLFTAPRVSGDYSTCEPLPQKLKMLRDLHAMGHYIILCTARRMRTHAGNVGAVIADIGATTIATLAEENVPYHELHFGKPWAQFYIDDHAVSAYSDLDKELGYYPPSPPVVQTKYTKPPVHTARAASKKDPSWLTVALATYAVAATACILLRKK